MRREGQGVFLYYFFSLFKDTDYFYVIGHSVNLLVQILTPLFLYLLAKKLSGKDPFVAFLIAMVSIVYPVDITQSIFCSISYRLSILATLASFYLTLTAFQMRSTWPLWTCAFMLTGYAQYLLMETVMSLEAARVAMVVIFLRHLENDRKIIFRKTALYCVPFFFLALPLIYYKLTIRPYGIYTDHYSSDFYFILNWKMHLMALSHFFFSNWALYLKKLVLPLSNEHFGGSIVGPTLVALAGVSLSFYLLNRIPEADSKSMVAPRLRETLKAWFQSKKNMFVVAALLTIPPVFMYEFVGRVPSFGFDSRHGIAIQTGVAFFWGNVIHLVSQSLNRKAGRFFLSIFIAVGLFFNNFNIDLAFDNWAKQGRFWQKFVQRFQSLPENATFMFALDYFDNKATTTLIHADEFNTAYDLEFPLNLLFTTSHDPKRFLRYTVIPFRLHDESFRLLKVNDLKGTPFYLDHSGHHGTRRIDPKKVIFIGYDGQNVLVNREILKKFSVNHPMMDRDFPVLPTSNSPYIFRYKLEEFY